MLLDVGNIFLLIPLKLHYIFCIYILSIQFCSAARAAWKNIGCKLFFGALGKENSRSN